MTAEKIKEVFNILINEDESDEMTTGMWLEMAEILIYNEKYKGVNIDKYIIEKYLNDEL